MRRTVQRYNLTDYETEVRRYERRRRVLTILGGIAVLCGLAVIVDLFF